MRRGEIWWANLPRPAGRRPVLLLSRNSAYGVRTHVTLATVTRTVHGIRAEVALGPEDGLPEPCVVNLGDIQTFHKSALDKHIATLSPHKMAQVNEAIRFALAIP